jgi:hypothetical protein
MNTFVDWQSHCGPFCDKFFREHFLEIERLMFESKLAK